MYTYIYILTIYIIVYGDDVDMGPICKRKKKRIRRQDTKYIVLQTLYCENSYLVI